MNIKTKEIKESLFGCYNEDTGKIETERGGHIYCKNCYSNKGVYSRNYYRKDEEDKGYFKLFKRCANCRSLEVTNNYTGEILKQEQNMTQYSQFKLAFYNHLQLLKERK